MRKVMGGVISTDTALEVFLNQIPALIATMDDINERNAMEGVLINGCHQAHREMNDASPYNGNY
jgi:hypothetical protein